MGSWSLFETTSWDQGDTGVFQHFQTIEQVWGLSLSCFLNFFRQFDLRERIHGTFNLIARNIFHSSQKVGNKTGSFLQWIKQGFVLSLKTDSGRLLDVLERWVAHKVDHELTNWVRAKVDALDFDELGGDVGVEVVDIHVAASETALSQETLWDRVKGH